MRMSSLINYKGKVFGSAMFSEADPDKDHEFNATRIHLDPDIA
jgi:hypothetical protein